MDVREAAAIARQQIAELFAGDLPKDMRLETFLYDDHLMVWSLTIGFALCGNAHAAETQPRSYKVVRVSEANKSVLSVSDP